MEHYSIAMIVCSACVVVAAAGSNAVASLEGDTGNCMLQANAKITEAALEEDLASSAGTELSVVELEHRSLNIIPSDYYDPCFYPTLTRLQFDLLVMGTEIVVNTLRSNNIWFVADSGTFTGALRHKGIIPWDHDVDFLFDGSDFSNIVNGTVCTDIKKASGVKTRTGEKVYVECCNVRETRWAHFWSVCACSASPCTDSEPPVIEFTGANFNWHLNYALIVVPDGLERHWVPADTIRITKEVPFHHFTIPVANDTNGYFEHFWAGTQLYSETGTLDSLMSYGHSDHDCGATYGWGGAKVSAAISDISFLKKYNPLEYWTTLHYPEARCGFLETCMSLKASDLRSTSQR